MAIEIGQVAPDFTLKGNDDKEHSLSSYRGKPVVLAFYPLDFSPVCSKEHACFVEDYSKFNDVHAQVLGISVDSVWAHKAFAEKMGIKYPLLADFQPRGAVAATYGLFLADKGITERATVIVDGEGKVAYVKVHGIPNAREDAELLAELAKLA